MKQVVNLYEIHSRVLVYILDLETENNKFERLKNYLSGSKVEEKMTKKEGLQFISEQIKIFLAL